MANGKDQREDDDLENDDELEDIDVYDPSGLVDSEEDSGGEDDSEDSDDGDDSEDYVADDDDADDEDGEGDVQPAAAAKKKKQSAAGRIAELVKAKKAAELAAFEAEMKLIERENAASPAKTPTLPKEPKPEDFPYGEYDTDYIQSKVNYEVAKRLEDHNKGAEETAEQQNRAKYAQKLHAVLAEGKKKHDDFESIVQTTPFDPDLARMVLDSDNAVDIAYHFGNNIDDLRAVTRMSLSDRARFIGRLEGKLSATSAVRKKSKAPETPGSRKGKRKPKASEAKYGPSDQDEFDKAFFR